VGGIAGSERHLLSLLPALAEAGVEVRMCVAAVGRAADFAQRLQELGISHAVVPAGRDVSPPLVAALWREIRAFRPDLVHTHLIHADLHGQLAAQLAGVTGVSSIHSTHGFYEREPYRSLARLAGHRARVTIAISEHVKRFVESVGLSRRGAVRVIHYGIDSSSWPSTEDERDAARAELGLDRGSIAVGVASRLVPHKGHSLLLEAHVTASRERPELRLLIAGEGPLRAELERQAQPLGETVRFLGFVKGIREFMGACDVLTFPSQPAFGEGFGLAALEGMAAGRPIVATATCSLPEVVSAGESGFLIDPESADELAAVLVRLAEDPELRAKMGQAANRRAREAFSLESMVERTIAAYGEAC
jgi:glycosyltransferase involved in cell wall biosynthesis